MKHEPMCSEKVIPQAIKVNRDKQDGGPFKTLIFLEKRFISSCPSLLRYRFAGPLPETLIGLLLILILCVAPSCQVPSEPQPPALPSPTPSPTSIALASPTLTPRPPTPSLTPVTQATPSLTPVTQATPTRPVPSPTASPTATPSSFASRAQALLFPEGLPVLEGIMKWPFQTDTFEVLASLPIDINGDGLTERAIGYVVYGEVVAREYAGVSGFALLNHNGDLLLGKSPVYTETMLQAMNMQLQPLSPHPPPSGMPAFYSEVRRTLSQGMGQYHTTTGVVLYWHGGQLAPVWEDMIEKYGDGWLDFYNNVQKTVEFAPVGADVMREIVVHDIREFVNLSDAEGQRPTYPPYDAYLFKFYAPGKEVYRWDGHRYVRAALRVPSRNLSLRPNPLLAYAAHLTVPPRIDGDITDSKLGIEYWMPLGIAYNHTHQGDAGRVTFLWDRVHLYVVAEVQDDVLVQTQQGDRLYLGDHLELWLDTDLYGDFNDAAHNQDDVQIGLSPGNFDDLPPEAVVWLPASLATQGNTIQVAARRNDHGYTLEAAIPLALLGLDLDLTPDYEPVVLPDGELSSGIEGTFYYRLMVEHIIGFGLQATDTDTPGAAAQEQLASQPETLTWGAPLTWGNLVFVIGGRW